MGVSPKVTSFDHSVKLIIAFVNSLPGVRNGRPVQRARQRSQALGFADGDGQDRRDAEGRLQAPDPDRPRQAGPRPSSAAGARTPAARSRSTRWATCSRGGPGEDETLPPVMVGSHLDTQPTGGKFDGVLGVLGALEVVRSLNDLKIKTRHPIEVANWTNEEGSRFAPAMVSSGRVRRRLHQGIRLFAHRPGGQDARRRARAHRLQGRGADRRPAGARLLRAPYRAGADPRGRERSTSASSPMARASAGTRFA